MSDALKRVLKAVRSTKEPDYNDLQEVASYDDYYLETQLSTDDYNAVRYWLVQNGFR